jgi:hypothetical protein
MGSRIVGRIIVKNEIFSMTINCMNMICSDGRKRDSKMC